MVSASKQHALGRELRSLRERANLRLVDLETRVGLSYQTLSRTERGERLPKATEVARILGALGVTGDEAERVVLLADEAQRSNWLIDVPNVPRQLPTLIDWEEAAVRIVEVVHRLLPGLLQTRDYARAIFEAGGVPPREISTRVKVRLDRQGVLTRPDLTEFIAIIDEPALARPVGSPETTAAQLQHILTMMELPNVTVQVFPYGRVPIGGSYVLLEPAGQPEVVHVEHHRGGAFLDDKRDVAAYLELTDRLRELALSPTKSAELITKVISTLEGA